MSKLGHLHVTKHTGEKHSGTVIFFHGSGGLSMGGTLSFHIGYRWHRDVAGTFVFGSFLNNNSVVYKELNDLDGVRLPPLLQIHGNVDNLVDVSWGQRTFDQLRTLGVEGEFHVMPGLGHSINERGMTLVKKFIENHLPQI